MNTWLKSVWENVGEFHITIVMAPLPISPPSKGDKWFMQAVKESGVKDPGKLTISNRF
jgi:hypothetical protein